MTVGGLFAAIMISDMMITPVNNLSQSLSTFFATKAVKKNLFSAFNVNDSKKDCALTTIDSIDTIEFNGVSFSYVVEGNGDEPTEVRQILNNINLEINKGEKCLLTGDNGSGKSTIIRLLLGQYGEYEGDILINGINFKEIDKDSLYSIVGYAEQQPMIFFDTVKNNISLFKEYDETELAEALKIVGLDKAESLNLEKVINNAIILDGERQKIALARLYLQGKKLIILDEAMNSLDVNTYNQIMDTWLNGSNMTLLHIEHSASYRQSSIYNKVAHVKDGFYQ